MIENLIQEYYIEPDKICPKDDVEKDDHFENTFVLDTEEESVENNTGQEAGLILL